MLNPIFRLSIYSFIVTQWCFTSSNAASIEAVHQLGGGGQVGERVQWQVDIPGNYDNPFDPDQVRLDAEITTPDGKGLVIPGFYMQPYQLELKADKEETANEGTGHWRLRYRPAAAGEHTIVIKLTDQIGTAATQPMTFTIAESSAPFRGKIIVSPQNPYAFAHENGDAYLPMGLNLCTPPGSREKGPPQKVFFYDQWFKHMQDNGMNFGRLWLAPSFNLLNLWSKPGQVDQEGAARLDHVMDAADQVGIALMMCIDVHLNLMAKRYFWESNPMNAANGGPISSPPDFWNSDEANRLFKIVCVISSPAGETTPPCLPGNSETKSTLPTTIKTMKKRSSIGISR